VVFYEEKIPHKTLSGGIGRKSLPTIGIEERKNSG
jgi:hypothetical protein